MGEEILEAVHLAYEDNPDVEAACYVELGDACGWLSHGAMERLRDMDRCPYCGEKLIYTTRFEYHDEGKPEEVTDAYCPNCR